MLKDEVDQIHAIYLKAGLIRSREFKEPEDHVALQLYFMAYLCRRAAEHMENGNLQDLLKNLKIQKTFLDEHLLKWVPKLAVDVIENADTSFYKAIGKITKGLLNMERTAIKELIKQAENMKGKF
jgi:anaerobic sulfite reductase subunit A